MSVETRMIDECILSAEKGTEDFKITHHQSFLTKNIDRLMCFDSFLSTDKRLEIDDFRWEQFIYRWFENACIDFFVEDVRLTEEVINTWKIVPFIDSKRTILYTDGENIVFFAEKDAKGVSVYFRYTESTKDALLNVFKYFIPINKKKKSYDIGYILNSSHGLYVKYINGSLKYDLSYEKHFNDGFKEFADDVYLAISQRKNGLYILHGDPGTGKTSFIKSLAKDSRRKFIYIPTQMSDALSSPDLLPLLIDEEDAVLVLEDCSKELITREQNYSPASVTNLLNLTDGFFADFLNFTVIATVNMDIGKIDPALLRAGRCLGHYKFEKLSVDKIQALGFESTVPKTLAEVFSGKNKDFDLTQRNKIGF